MENMQDLLSDPMFIMQAELRSMIPQQYAATLTDQEIQGHLTRIEVVNRRSPSPVLESGPALAAVKPKTPILTPVAEPVLESRVEPAPAATQPAPALTSGNGSVNYSDLVRANGALSATEGDRSGAYQPWDYTMGAIAEPLPDKQAVVVDASNQPPAPVLEGYHQMPDGSMMPNSEMSNSTGLTPNPSAVGAADPYAPPPRGPVLTNPAQPAPPAAAALTDATGTTTGTTNGTTGGTGSVNGGLSATARTASGGSTGNARGSNMAYSKIDNGESLIRIGGAMYSGALQGNGIGAATQEYGSIQDANRASEAEAFKQAEATRLAELRARAVGSKAGSKEATKAQAAANHAAIKLRDVDAALKGLDDYDGVVGIGYWFNKGWDLLTDSQRSTVRQKIARVKVDATLSNTAFTKGAISDREMKIFQSDQPSWMAGENAWRTYLNEYRDALLIMNSNLASGATPYAASNKTGSGGTTGGSSNTAAADAIVGI